MRGRRLLSFFTVLVAIIQGACLAPGPTSSPAQTTPTSGAPTTTQLPTAPPGPTDTPAVRPTETPGPPPTPGAPISPSPVELIEADLAAGVLDEPTATLYRLYASVGDNRLAEQYRGEFSEDDVAEEDDVAAVLAREGFATYTADLQAEMLPFLVRPNSPLSYWAAATEATSAQSIANHGPLIGQSPSACVDGWMRQPANAPAKAVVWGQCGGMPEADMLAKVNQAKRYIGELWTDMTALMGEPIGDKEDPADPRDDFPETNDGLLDFYIIDHNVGRHGRYIGAAYGANYGAYPFAGPVPARTASSYIALSAFIASGSEFKSVIAHEFFHSLQKRHNWKGIYISRGAFWFTEASATWAEYKFVPEGRSHIGKPRWAEFLAAGESLSANYPEDNPYRSWMWPFFMTQEAGKESIAAAWTAMKNQYGFLPLQTAVDRQVQFKGRFRDFAVRLWNEKLDGNPFKRFQDFPSDLLFWEGHPPAARLGLKDHIVQAEHPSAPARRVGAVLPSLWTNYATMEVEDDVGQLILDFSTLSPASALDVDLLVEVDGTWKRQQVSNGRARFCRDNSAEEVDNVIVVLSNHDLNFNNYVTGDWTVQGLKAGCAALSGTITIARTSAYNEADGPMWTRDEQMTATIVVDMEPDPDPFGGGGYIDFGSTYTVVRTTLERRQMGDCTASYGTKTNGTWDFSSQPVPESGNNLTGFVDRDLDIVLLSILITYPFTATEDICNLYTAPNIGAFDTFNCGVYFGAGVEGNLVEVEDGPDRVNFNCTNDLPGMGWTTQQLVVTGSLTLADEQASSAP